MGELISAQLENPFGRDANDLPCHDFHDEMNEGLLVLTNPEACQDFHLQGDFIAVHTELRRKLSWSPLDLSGDNSLIGKSAEMSINSDSQVDSQEDLAQADETAALPLSESVAKPSCVPADV